MNKIINRIKDDTIFDTIFWIFLIYFYFINRDIYFFIIDFFIILKLFIKIGKREKIEINKHYFILFSLFFFFSSLLILFYPIKFNPLLSASVILLIILFSFSGINFNNAKYPLLFLPFLSIIYYFIFHQTESSFIFKHSSLLGMLLVFGFVFFKENRIMNIVYITAIIFTFSKTTYILLFIIIGLLLYNHYKKDKNINSIAILSTIILFFVFSLFFIKSIKSDPFVKGRFKIWKTAFKTGYNYFPLGIGGFNFPYYTDGFKETTTHKINDNLKFYKQYLNDKINLEVYNTKTAQYEHNILLKLFTEYGIIGIFFIMVLIYLFFKFLNYYSPNDKLILLSLLFYSMLQNFTMNYLFLLPFVSILFFQTGNRLIGFSPKFTIDRKTITLILLIYFIGYSFPFLLNQVFIIKNPSFAKRILPFDIRPDLQSFNAEFNQFQNKRELKNLLLLELKGKKILTYNNRLKDIYSILAESFFNLYRVNKNRFFRKKTLYYLKEWLKIEPFSPFLHKELSLLNFDSDIKTAKSEILKSLEIEPFFVKGLIVLKKLYKIENNKKNTYIIEKVLTKINKDKIKYKYKGKSSYERLVLYEK